MPNIYHYIPENFSSRVHNVAAIQWLQYGTCSVISHDERFVLINQYFPQYVRGAQYGCFYSSLMSCYPGMLFRYFLNLFKSVPVAPDITGYHLFLNSTYSMSKMVQNFAVSFWKLSAFECRINISRDFTLFDVLKRCNVLPLDALRRLTPSVGISVHSMEDLF